MAASVTGTSGNGRGSGVTSISWSHTSNGDPLLVLLDGGSGSVKYKGVTFNGLDLILGGRTLVGGNYLEWWYHDSPGTATANVVATTGTFSSPTGGSFNVNLGGSTVELSKPVVYTASGTSTTPSVVATSQTNGLVIDMVASNVTNQTYAVGAGQTKTWGQDSLAVGDTKCAGSWEAGAASVTMSWTLGTSNAWRIQALAFGDPAASSTERYSQVVAEVAGQISAQVRYSQMVAEVASNGATDTRYSQLVAEVASGANQIRYSQIVVEVATSLTIPIITKVPPKGGGGHHGSPQGKKVFNTSLWVPWSEFNTFGNG